MITPGNNKCGHIAQENHKKERFFCLECNHLEDSDTQVAKNILARGLKQLGINLNQLPKVYFREKINKPKKRNYSFIVVITD